MKCRTICKRGRCWIFFKAVEQTGLVWTGTFFKKHFLALIHIIPSFRENFTDIHRKRFVWSELRFWEDLIKYQRVLRLLLIWFFLIVFYFLLVVVTELSVQQQQTGAQVDTSATPRSQHRPTLVADWLNHFSHVDVDLSLSNVKTVDLCGLQGHCGTLERKLPECTVIGLSLVINHDDWCDVCCCDGTLPW